MTAIDSAIAWLQTGVSALSGIDHAPPTVSDTASNRVWVYTYLSGGEYTTVAAGDGRDFHTLRVEIMTYRGNLVDAVKRLQGLPQAVARLVQADPTMGGNVSTYGTMVYNFTAVEWAGQAAVGYIITIDRIKTVVEV